MEKININFALDVQEQTNNTDNISALKIVLEKYIDKIDRSKSTNNVLAFVDNSGCRFEEHDIILIDKIST